MLVASRAPHLRSWLRASLLVGSFAIAGCSGDPAAPAGSADDGARDIGQNEGISTVEVAGLDTPPPDAAPPICDGAPLAAGCPCASSDDCSSGFCIPTDAGKQCLDSCIDSCSPGFSCVSLALGTDLTLLCFPRFAKLCQPCREHADCAGKGDSQISLCLDYGTEGRFCGAGCDDSTPCPDGYACEPVPAGPGAAGHQCRLAAGVCECNTYGKTLALSTDCSAVNEAGACAGARACTDGGLAACDAPSPAAEQCDQVDNDCDGITDDLGPSPDCDITNNYGTCVGVLECHSGVAKCEGPVPVPEVCNGFDDDCDGETDEGYANTEGDALADCVDPDDDEDGIADEVDVCPLISDPGQSDSDADGTGDACDSDPDGDGFVEPADCAGDDGAVYPGAEEHCNGVDDDCNGETDDQVCEDGVPCTFDHCDAEAGGCSHSPNASACDDGDPCTDDVCELDAGCLHPGKTGPVCDDGNACTFGDGCLAGKCTGTSQSGCCVTNADCDDGIGCTLDICIPGSGCSNPPAPDATPCDADQNGCTNGDRCLSGACVAGAEITCPAASEACRKVACASTAPNAYACVATPETAITPCDDGLFCTALDHCDGAGVCVGGQPNACATPNGACQLGVCHEASGSCEFLPTADGAACDADADGCTIGDTCFDGACHPGSQAVCAGGDICTSAVCRSVGAHDFACGFEPEPVNKSCDDGLFCTVDDHCDGTGSCAAGAPRDCQAAVAVCQVGFCDEVDGGCRPIAAPDGAECDDGDACTTVDVCGFGACHGSGSFCAEERLSLATGAGHIDALPLPNGRFATLWFDGGSPTLHLRVTDAQASRENSETSVSSTSDGPQTLSFLGISPVGEAAAAYWNTPSCSCSGFAKCDCVFGELRLARFGLDGERNAESVIETNKATRDIGTANIVTASAEITAGRLVVHGFADGTYSVIHGEAVKIGAATVLSRAANQLRLIPTDTNLAAGDPVVLVEPPKLYDPSIFDTKPIPGSTDLLLAWATNSTFVDAKRITRTGALVANYAGLLQGTSSATGVRVAPLAGGGSVAAIEFDFSGVRQIAMHRWNAEGVLVAAPAKPIGADFRLTDLEALPDGRFVLLTQVRGADIDGWAVKAFVYTSAGTSTQELMINTAVDGDQTAGALAVFPDSGFAVAFREASGHVVTRRFDGQLAALAGRPERSAAPATTLNRHRPSAATAGGGKTLISWENNTFGADPSDVRYRVFDVKGIATSPDLASGETLGTQTSPAVAAGNGAFVLAWRTVSGAASTASVQRIALDGAPGAAAAANTPSQQVTGGPALASLGNLGTLIGYPASELGGIENVHLAVFGPTSGSVTPLGALENAGGSQVRLASVPESNEAVVVWRRAGGSPGIAVRRVGATGPVGAAADLAFGNTVSAPAVTASSDGTRVLVCWVETIVADLDLVCRLLDGGLVPVAALFRPAATLSTLVSEPALTTLTTGGFVAAWSTDLVDDQSLAVHFRRIASTGAPVGPRVVANRKGADTQRRPFVTGTPAGLLVGWESGTADSDVRFRVLPPP